MAAPGRDDLLPSREVRSTWVPRALEAADAAIGGAAPSRRGGRVLTVVRLVHPFPSLLDGAIVGVVASVAGAEPSRATILGLSTVLLQFAVGALKDFADLKRDGAGRARKPIVEALAGERAALAVVIACAAAGLALALTGGPALLLVAAGGLAIGTWYELAARGTAISWLPMALGVPLLPVYGWLGTTGSLPPAFAVLVPGTAVAGAALAIANTIVDVERDRAAALASIAVMLGPIPSAALVLLLQIVVGALAVVSTASPGASGTWHQAAVAGSLVPVAGAALGLLVANRRPAAREVAFEIQTVGLALLAVAWVNAWSLGAT